MQINLDDPLRYDRRIEEALRGVIRRAILYAADNGLPGEHHFYVTFRTDVDEVTMPDYLRAQHPEEMTIVLQHQFEDLGADEESFSVTLRFGGKPERLIVPFEHVTAFTDPAVNFGLQLKVADDADDDAEAGDGPAEQAGLPEDAGAADAVPDAPAEVLKHPGEAAAQRTPDSADKPDEQSGEDDEEEDKEGEVIALDAFRKK